MALSWQRLGSIHRCSDGVRAVAYICPAVKTNEGSPPKPYACWMETSNQYRLHYADTVEEAKLLIEALAALDDFY